MANPVEKSGIPATTVHSPMKGYVTMAPVNQPPPPPPPYSQHQPPHQSSHPGGYSISGLISPPASHTAESRRTSDDPSDYHQQQQQQPRLSLPSISEALYNPTRPAQGPAPAAPPPPQAFPNSNPFARPAQPPVGPAPPSARPYGGAVEDRPTYAPQTGHSHYVRRSPPPPLHPAPSYTAEPPYSTERHAPLPSLRTALPSQTGPYSPRHHPEQSRYEPAPRPVERREEFHPPPPPRRNEPYYGYAPAPTNGYTSGYGPRPASPYQSQGPYAREEHLRPYSREDPLGRKRDIENGESPSMMFQKQLRHNLGNHDFEMALGELQQCGVEASKIADDLLDTVRRYQSSSDMHGIPVMRYHDALLGCQRKIEEAFQNVKGFMAQQQRQLDDHRMRNEDKRADYGDEEPWGMDKDQGFHGGSDAKKIRRGQRAAPPGRCHSCNRAETPEWRRGPDGARTLCNACGLHYAKLTRRMGNKQAQSAAGSSLRPKSMDEAMGGNENKRMRLDRE